MIDVSLPFRQAFLATSRSSIFCLCAIDLLCLYQLPGMVVGSGLIAEIAWMARPGSPR